MRRIKDFKGFVLNEKRTQLNIPFNEVDPIHGKMHHEHIKDALEDMQIMKPEAYTTSVDYDELIRAAIPKALKSLYNQQERIRDYITTFVFGNLKDNSQYWKSEFFKDNDLDVKDITLDNNDLEFDTIEAMDVTTDLTEEGLEAWETYFENQAEEDIYKMWDTVEQSQKENDGLIDVWRAITFGKEDYEDVYDSIVKGHQGGIGQYWSWEETAAEAHWGTSKNDSKLFVIHGHVRPEDVDWDESVLKNIYDLKDEEELELKEDGAIKIVGMSTDDEKNNNVYIEFETPFVVKVGTSTKTS